MIEGVSIRPRHAVRYLALHEVEVTRCRTYTRFSDSILQKGGRILRHLVPGFEDFMLTVNEAPGVDAGGEVENKQKYAKVIVVISGLSHTCGIELS